MTAHDRRVRILKERHMLVRAARSFFDERGYVEVDTPSLVYQPQVDAYIDAIEVSRRRFLITSPEIHMKMLLAEGLGRIYQICHAFREGESGPWHNPEFTMLEWYRAGADYFDLMKEAEELVCTLASMKKIFLRTPFRRESLSSLFLREAGWDPVAQWDEDRFMRDLVEKAEPSLSRSEAVFIYDYPAPTASMAKLKESFAEACERFELYICGIEIANGYTELRDAREQKARFLVENEIRRKSGKPTYPIDESFIESLRRGLPPCAGVALGVDRFLAYLLRTEGIRDIMVFPEERLKR